MERWFAIALAALLAACADRPPPPRPAPRPVASGRIETWSPAPLATDGDYPPRYFVLSDAELARRTNAAEAAAPGWRVMLDPLGFLYSATCLEACPGPLADPNAGFANAPPLSTEDQTHVEQFLAKNDPIVAANGPSVSTKTPNERQVNYTQGGSNGNAGTMRVWRASNGLTIVGHLWPQLPTASVKPDAEIERLLRRLENAPDLVVRRGYRTTIDTVRGPVELRLAAWLARPSEDPIPAHERPTHPCVDAHTGEDITNHLSGTHVTIVNGVVTKRKLTHAN